MLAWLKKHFIPHEGNNHRPHILHRKSIRNILLVVVFLEVFTFLIPIVSKVDMNGGMAAVLPAILSNLTNGERETQHLKPLIVDPLLNKAAEMKAKDMALKGYFAHTSPEGKTPWYWLKKVGYNYQYAGENLAINFSDSKDVVLAWMASPPHRANIEKINYTEIGTGVAEGIYKGRKTIFVAQEYANPLPRIYIAPVVHSNRSKSSKNIAITKNIKKTNNLKTINEANVLGAETETNKINIGVNNTPNNINTSVKTNQNNIVKINVIKPTFWQKAFASPRNTMDTILYIVFGLITIALILYIVIKMRNHHIDLITNGLIFLAIIGIIFVANYYITHKNMIIIPSIDYSYTNK